MSDDIVARLRVLNHHAKKLAENESLHDLHREAFTRCEKLTWEAADELERLRAERDAARRMYCVMRDGEDGLNCKEWSDRKGWDCFKENA